MLSLFATNLSLFLSVLWCLCNGLVYALPCCYAATIWSLRKGEVTTCLLLVQCRIRSHLAVNCLWSEDQSGVHALLTQTVRGRLSPSSLGL